MKVSVALATYNGARFLDEQLNSLAGQDRPPDEIVICDDCSTDATQDILTRWTARHSWMRWSPNEQNLGVTGNFSRAISQTTGDVIFLCDQDDIWLPHKISTCLAVFEKHSQAAYVFSDAVRMDEHDQELPQLLWESLVVPFPNRDQNNFTACGGFSRLLRSWVVTGCTLAFRAPFRELILPIPSLWIHDAWIALCLSAVAGGIPVAEPLIRYRQHGNQQIGERRRSLFEQFQLARQQDETVFRKRLNCFELLHERLTTQSVFDVEQERILALDRKIAFLDARLQMRHRRLRWPLIIRHLLRNDYSRFAEGWKAVCQDLLLP